MLAFWCIAQWQEAGMPQSLHLIEMGPGRGTLMQDILRIGEHQEGFIESLTISCVEICPNLYEQQQQALSDYPFVFWYKNLSEVPKGADFTILLANEFFDTLPVRQFVSHEERTVRYSEKENALIFSPPANPHSIKETCPMGEELMHEVMGHLTPGVALMGMTHHQKRVLVIHYKHFFSTNLLMFWKVWALLIFHIRLIFINYVVLPPISGFSPKGTFC